ncbi:MAG: hypothetical protein QM758_15515 [Armatimonas sp.]
MIAAMESAIVLSGTLSNEDKKYWYGYARSFKSLWARYSDPVYYRLMVIVDVVSEYQDQSLPEKLQEFGWDEGIWELECLIREYGGEYWTERLPAYEVSNIFEYVFDRVGYFKAMKGWVGYDYENCPYDLQRIQDSCKMSLQFLKWDGENIKNYILAEGPSGGYSPLNLRPVIKKFYWDFIDERNYYLDHNETLKMMLIENGFPVCYCDANGKYVEIEMLKVPNKNGIRGKVKRFTISAPK